MSAPILTAMSLGNSPTASGLGDAEPFYYGSKADLQPGDLLVPGYASNFRKRDATDYIYFAATPGAAMSDAERSAGVGSGRIYRVEPTGPFEDNLSLTDKKFAGDPTLYYRSREPIRVLGEVWDFDMSFDYKTDNPRKTKPDADRDSPRLRSLHEVLWTKRLKSGVLFAPKPPSRRRDGYLIFTDASGAKHWFGSDAITASYTNWLRPKALVDAIAGLTPQQRMRYLNPSYTIGSAMIWPVRSADRPTINQARGIRSLIADRMDLTLECIRRHYAGEIDSPLADVLHAYADFFALFDGFKEFVDFFFFQDLVTPNYDGIEFYFSFDGFNRPGTPMTTAEYLTYREATLDFIGKRTFRIAEWLGDNSSRTAVGE